MVDKKEAVKRANAPSLAFIVVLAILLVSMFGFANAVTTIYFINISNGSICAYRPLVFSNSTYIINEDITYQYNLTINHTSTDTQVLGSENISQVNVSLFGNFVYVNGSNRTGLIAGGTFAPTVYFDNISNQDGYLQSGTTSVLSWNRTGANGFIVNSTNGTAFMFNMTARTPGKFNITVTILYNASGLLTSYINRTNFTIIVNDTTAPRFVNFSVTPTTMIQKGGNYSGNLALKVNVTDNYALPTSLFFNVTNSTGNSNKTTTGATWFFQAANSTGILTAANSEVNDTYVYTLDTRMFPDGNNYNITIWVNDSNGNLNNTYQMGNLTFDNSAPTGTISCTPSSVNRDAVVTCACSAADSVSGLNTSYLGTSDGLNYDANPDTSETGTFTTLCSFADMAGNVGTVSTTYDVNQPMSSVPSSSGSSSPSPSAPVTKTSTFTQIVPGTPATASGFASGSGVNQIQIEVSQTANNVQLTVDDYNSKPSAVSSEKTDAYKYIHVDTQNLADKLSKATMRIQVLKSWVSSNNLNTSEVSLFRYDNSSSQWNELTTTYSSEDSTYYYYNVQLTGFSYFAIAPNSVASATSTGETQPSASINNSWVWIVVGIVVLAIIIGGGFALKKKRKK